MRRSWCPIATSCASKTGLCRGVSDEISVLHRDALGDLEFTRKLQLCPEKTFSLYPRGLTENEEHDES